MAFLKVSGIYKNKGEEAILKGIDFEQKQFQKIAIAGATGSGKSTLMKIIAGHVQPDAGTVYFEEELVEGPDWKLLPGHDGIAYLSQHFELRNNYRIEELLIYANPLSDKDAAVDEKAIALYEICDIAQLLKRKTDQVSGGEKQRVALTRLLLTEPKLLLLDEPFSNLDMIHKNVLKSVLKNVSERLLLTCIMVSHDPLDTMSWADEIIVMKDGRIIQKGTPALVYRQPVDEYTAGLFGVYNLIDTNIFATILEITEENKDRKLFIRPEFLQIVSDEKNTIKGAIKKATFFGSYYEVEVLVEEKILTLKTQALSNKENDEVAISIIPHELWYL